MGSQTVIVSLLPGVRVSLRADPGRQGELTGNSREIKGRIFYEVRFPDRTRDHIRPEHLMGVDEVPETILEAWKKDAFSGPFDLRAILAVEKFSGDMRDHLYSLNTGRIEFLSYQFKPVIKFINSPTERLLIADEVGLGKTIEAALIWQELRVRRDARRLLIVCPKMLTTKWRDELANRFDIAARIGGAKELQEERSAWRRYGGRHSFVLIAPYTALRPNRTEYDEVFQEQPAGKIRSELLRDLAQDERGVEAPFLDLLIMDEAHYLRNPSSMLAKLAEILQQATSGLLLLSATPVSNKSRDLLALLRLLDEATFKEENLFEALCADNRPAVQALNSLAATPPEIEKALKNLRELTRSAYVGKSELLRQAMARLAQEAPPDAAERSHLIRQVEQLNVLNSYISRTRRAQVEHRRPKRDITALKVVLDPVERQFYDKVVEEVRKSLQGATAFSQFHLLHPQLRMTSCFPAMAEAYAKGEAAADWEGEGEWPGMEETEAEASVLETDFSWVGPWVPKLRAVDSKFKVFLNRVRQYGGEKQIVFSFFKGTLHYLEQRLRAEGFRTALIHGDIPLDERLARLSAFEHDPTINILLTSEVGAEGLDLQFSHILFNYDLPWNPMRIEQRIGRIDRIGQKAAELKIHHFQIEATIEARVYEVLFEKLNSIVDTIGSIEPVIADDGVNKVMAHIYRENLSPEDVAHYLKEETKMIEENHRRLKQDLADEQTNLFGVTPFVDRFIGDAQTLHRNIGPLDLRALIDDFFQHHYPGVRVHWGDDAETLELEFTFEAESAYDDFVQLQRLQATRPQGRKLSATLRGDRLPLHSLVQHLTPVHPLIKWIVAEMNKGEKERCHIALVSCHRDDIPERACPPGFYAFFAAKWIAEGIRTESYMTYALLRVHDLEEMPPPMAEALVLAAARHGKKRSRAELADVSDQDILLVEDRLEELRILGRETLVDEAREENTTLEGIRRAQIENRYRKKAGEFQERVANLDESNPAMRLARAGLKKAEEDYRRASDRLSRQARFSSEFRLIASGLIQVIGTPK